MERCHNVQGHLTPKLSELPLALAEFSDWDNPFLFDRLYKLLKSLVLLFRLLYASYSGSFMQVLLAKSG